MKKVVFLLLSLSLLLCACLDGSVPNASASAVEESPHINADEINIGMMNVCDTAVYGIHIEYYIDDNAYGGMVGSRNPEMSVPFGQGELIYCYIPFGESPPDNVSNFKMEVYIILENGNLEIPIMEHWGWDAELGVYYGFVLSQAADGGFIITAQDNDMNYTVTPIEG